MKEVEFRQNLVGESAGDVLRDFGMGRIPFLGFRLDGQFDGWIPRATNLLQAANVNLRNKLKQTFRRPCNMLPKQIPMIGQWHNRRLTEMFCPTKRLGERRWPSHLSVQTARRMSSSVGSGMITWSAVATNVSARQ